MPTMWDPSTRQRFQDRVDRLAPSATPQWGKLTVAGMLAHLNRQLPNGHRRPLVPHPAFGNLSYKEYGS